MYIGRKGTERRVLPLPVLRVGAAVFDTACGLITNFILQNVECG